MSNKWASRAARAGMLSILGGPSAILFVSLAVAAGCGSAISASQSDSKYTDVSVDPNGGTGGGNTTTSGLPCDVVDVLAAACLSCHSSPPRSNAPMALTTYDDLTQMSDVDATMTVAQRSVLRMKDAASPMPPGAAATSTAAEIAALQAWIDAGYPQGTCDPAADPFAAPPQCTSGKTWTQGDHGGDRMYPGRACIDCHTTDGEGEAPIFQIAGTVYPTAHEPNNCVSNIATLSPGAVVEITDKNGNTVQRSVNSSGNFTYQKVGFAYPYTAKVIYNGKERVMTAPQMSGDCNACHTQDGTEDAPGRIILP